jgi:integrase
VNGRAENNSGTVRTIRNRKGQVTGYQALLPRDLSRAPVGHPNPDDYREPLGEPMPTYDAARGMLTAALVEARKNPLVGRGPDFAWMLDAEIKGRHTRARRELGTDVKANKLVSTWRSMERTWFVKAPFYRWTCAQVSTNDIQAWIVDLRDTAENFKGEPLSPDYIRGIIMLARSVFDRAGVKPNPARDVDLPERTTPKVPHWLLETQRLLFGADSDKLSREHKIMIGCGMGAGLRVGELLAIELGDVFLDGPDPHLVVRYGGADRSPTKSRKPRTVELFEPGLGFWRLALAERPRRMTRNLRQAKSRLVFVGPRGGFRKEWPELFPGWGEALGLPGETTSHLMRHTYAVSMLSGTWGYAPRSLEFVQKQLGHESVQTTEKYYGAFHSGVWRSEVRIMTGRPDMADRIVVTAEALLGAVGGSIGSAVPQASGSEENSSSEPLPRHSPKVDADAENQPRPSGLVGASPQSTDDPDELEFWLALAEHQADEQARSRLAKTAPYIARKRVDRG